MATADASKEKEVEEVSEVPLKCKTWVLKVSVHCEGCKKKVKKILQNIDGVYTTNIDLKQQKAIVIGNVAAETLINKLIKKTGKHAELWPDPKPTQKEKKQGKSKKKEKKEKQNDSETSDQEAEQGGEKEKPTVKVEVVVQESAKNSEGGSAKVSEVGAGGQAKEAKSEGKRPETPVTSTQPPVVEKKDGGEGETSNGVKKKKKKGQNGSGSGSGSGNGNGNNVVGGEHTVNIAPTNTGSPKHIPETIHISPPANHSPPSQVIYQYAPPHYYAPPVYAMSYNTTHPSSSYGASYYAPQPPPHSYAYTYPYPSPNTEPSPFDLESPSLQQSDSFELFSDENPNGCSIM